MATRKEGYYGNHLSGVCVKLTMVVTFCCLLLSPGRVVAEEEGDEMESSPGDQNDSDIPKEDGVYVLTDANFAQFIQDNPTAMVEFYAPWCGHCKTFAPTYSKVAQILAEKPVPVPFAKVDATENSQIAQDHDVKGYPTVKFYKDGTPMDYDGDRTEEGLIQWIQEKTDPDYKPPPETVKVLTEDNFMDFVIGADISLVEFYAPWCGHCKQLAPEYERASQRLLARDPPIPLGKIDATVEKNLAKEYQVSGFPTLYIFRKGKHQEYKGPRHADGIVEYMIEQTKPAAKELKSLQDVYRLQDDANVDFDIAVVGFFADDNSKLFENFQESANANREDVKNMGYTFDAEAMRHYKAHPGTIMLFHAEKLANKYEKNFVTFAKQDASPEDITSFIKQNWLSLVGFRTGSIKGKRYGPDVRPICVVYYPVDFSHGVREETEFWRQKVLQVAKDYKDKYYFAVSNDEESTSELEAAGLGDSGQDVNVICYGKDGRVYPRDPESDDFSAETFREFMDELNRGQIRPHVKSQAAPKDNKGPVKVVVASTFDKIVNDESKDVLVEFYAPWCGHCKSLEPKYVELAKKLKHDSNLVIAKFDATANDVPPNYAVSGFPTIYFAPSGKKDEPISYTSGARTVEELEKFMKENAVKSFKKTEL